MSNQMGFIIAAGLMACAAPTDRTQTPTPSSRSLLMAEELHRLDPATTLLEAIERLRFEYVTPGRQIDGSRSRAYPTVLVDGVEKGGLAELHLIRIHSVKQVRYMSAAEARFWLGPEFLGPVILVTRGT